jgi:hypothetical protein
MSDLLPTETTPNKYEIGFLLMDKNGFEQGHLCKYIIAEVANGLYRLFAYQSEGIEHAHIRTLALECKDITHETPIVGGGRIRRHMGAGIIRKAILENRSTEFGQEPSNIREAFTHIVIHKLRDMGILAPEEQPTISDDTHSASQSSSTDTTLPNN